jgi:hypothetical protein
VSRSVPLTKYYSVDKIKEEQVGGECRYEEEKFIECLVGEPEIKRQLQGVRLG